MPGLEPVDTPTHAPTPAPVTPPLPRARPPTVADQVKANGGTVVSLSLKDRSAMMLGGRAPDAIAWFNRKTGTWNKDAPDFMDRAGNKAALEQPSTQ